MGVQFHEFSYMQVDTYNTYLLSGYTLSFYYFVDYIRSEFVDYKRENVNGKSNDGDRERRLYEGLGHD